MAQVISRKSKMKSRNRYELELMRKSGKIAASALKKAIETIKVGVTELEVDNAAREEIYRLGGDLSYKSVPGYKYATCITVNEQVVHGIPTERKFAALACHFHELFLCFIYLCSGGREGYSQLWRARLQTTAEEEKSLCLLILSAGSGRVFCRLTFE